MSCQNPIFVPAHARNAPYYKDDLFTLCWQLMCNLTQQDTSLFCPPLFDGVGCWPATLANTTQSIPCPDVAVYHSSDQRATHACQWKPRRVRSEIQNYTQGGGPAGINGSEVTGDMTWEWGPVWASHPDVEGLVWSDYAKCEAAILANEYKHVQYVFHAGNALSLVSVLIALLIFAYLPKLHCTRNIIHVHFFASIALFCIFYFIQVLTMVQLSKNTVLCSIIHVAVQYCLISTYFWMLSEAAFLHKTVVTDVFNSKDRLPMFIFIGWGIPLLIVGAYVATNFATELEGCWLRGALQGSQYITNIPLLLCLAVNVVLLVSVLRVLIPKLRTRGDSSNHQIAIKGTKAILFLSPLFGVHTLIVVWMPDETTSPRANMALGFTHATLQSLQGFVVAVVFCFTNTEVRHEIRTKYNQRISSRSFETSISLDGI